MNYPYFQSHVYIIASRLWSLNLLITNFGSTTYFLIAICNQDNIFVSMYTIIKSGTYSGSEHRSSEPDGVSLHLMGDHLHIDRLWLQIIDLLSSSFNNFLV